VTFVYAGEYAGDVIYRTQGAAGSVPVTVSVAGGGAATLYTSASKDTPLAGNVVDTDSLGNLAFFADPGTYTCTVGSASFTAVVPVNPLEPSEGGGGTVTSVTVESANGLAGTVADSATTPQVTLSTTVTGVLKGAGGAVEAATAGTDYLTPSGSGAALTGITAAQVGADASGAAATAQGNAETFATSAVATETSRAESAEALLAPLASPALTGSPTAPTQTSSDNSTKLATDAFVQTVATAAQTAAESFATSAVAAETSRAETAEGLLAPKANPALTGTPVAPTAAALTDSTQIATTAYTDSAVAVETSRAETAEALKAPLASPALTGNPTAPTQAASDNSTKLATTAYVTAAVKAQAAPAGFTPSNPPSFGISASQIMMGLGATCTYTPSGSGLVVVSLTAYVNNNSNDANLTGARYGSGSAPAGLLSATATNASPCVFTAAGSAFVNTTQVVLSGTVPTGFTAGTTYYVVSASGATFSLSATSGGSAINSSSTGSGISVGSVATGTRFGAVADTQVLGNGATPYAGCFAVTALLTLNPATAYWFDVACSAGGGHTSTVQNVGVTVFELP
jgi:hypothetical protein